MVGSKKVFLYSYVPTTIACCGLRGFGLEGYIAIFAVGGYSYMSILFGGFACMLGSDLTGFGFGAGLEGHLLAISPIGGIATCLLLFVGVESSWL